MKTYWPSVFFLCTEPNKCISVWEFFFSVVDSDSVIVVIFIEMSKSAMALSCGREMVFSVWEVDFVLCAIFKKKLFFESYFKNSDYIGNQSEFSFSSWTCLPFASMASCVFVNLDFTSWKLIYRRPDEKVELSSDIGSSHPFVGLAFKLEVRESNLLHINVTVSNIFYEMT